MNIKYKLSDKKKEKMKKSYDGTWKSVRNISDTYKISLMRARWLVNHNNVQRRLNEWVTDWRKKNPQRAKEIGSKAMKKYFATPEGKKVRKENSKKYYQMHKEELRIYYRKRYHEKKINK